MCQYGQYDQYGQCRSLANDNLWLDERSEKKASHGLPPLPHHYRHCTGLLFLLLPTSLTCTSFMYRTSVQLIIFYLLLPVHQSLITERRGPEFLVEPANSIVFLNDTGAIVTCSAKGTPAPSIVWTKVDGTPLTPVSGLRQIRKDLLTSQLVYQPFSAANYRQDVHSGTIRCVASNTAGAIQSQDVHIRASVKQPYEVQVYDDFAIKGNTGILRCHIPSFVREYVHVTNWLTYDDVQIHSNLLKGGRYSVLPNGELHVHRITDDLSATSIVSSSSPRHTSSISGSSSSVSGGSATSAVAASSSLASSFSQSNQNTSGARRLMFRCQTKHMLSGQVKLSANYGRLIVTEPQSRMPPKIVANLRHIVALSGETVELPCSTQAHPWPTFTWFRSAMDISLGPSSASNPSAAKRLNRIQVPTFKLDNHDNEDDEEFLASPYRISKAGRLVQVDSSLFIRDVTAQDSGLYVCVANNSVGQDRFEIELAVRAPLSVTINPSHILASDGDTVNFNCTISGSPVSRIQWRRNARPLAASPSLSVAGNRVHLFDNDHRLQIKQVRREDKGMFQCIITNEFESVQASTELALADDPPAFLNVFSVSEPLKPGHQLSIKCSATGVPLPQIVWTLDGSPLADQGRIRVGDYVSSDGVVNSFVNITTLRTEDGGIYSCTASNDVHSISHSGRINVYGPAFVRPMKNITAISGHNIYLHCPAAGYPLESIVWYKKTGSAGGARLPQNHRQKNLLNGTLLIEKVDRASDEDVYRCLVTSSGSSSKASAELYMRVLVAPVISPFNPPPNLREGMRVMLTCSVVEGDSPVLIQFLKDGESIHESASSMSRHIKLDVTNEFSATLYIASVTADDSGNYTCIASNMAAVATYSIVMKVNVPPKWKLAPSDTEAIEGQQVVIDCSASGEPRIWWERAYDKPTNDRLASSTSGQMIPISAQSHTSHYFRTVVSNSHMHTLENGSLMIRDVSEEDSGIYLCQANNGVGSGLSKVITLKVHVPAHFKSKFSAQTVQKGDSIEFICDAFGETPVHIGLAKDRMTMDLDSNNRLVNTGEQTLHADGRYRIIRKQRSDGLSLLVRIVNVDRRDSSLFTCLAANTYGKDEYNFQLIVQEPPGRPENLHILEADSRSAVVGWSSPYSGNSAIIAYHVEFRLFNPAATDSPWQDVSTVVQTASAKHIDLSLTNTGSVLRETIPGTENSFTLRSLRPMVSYEIRVQAENKLGLGPYTATLKVTTKEEAPSGPPLNIHVYPISAHSLQVTFQAPRSEQQNGQLLGYYVGYKALDIDEHFMFKKVLEEKASIGASSAQKEVKINDLRRATKFVVIVQAFNRIGPGPQSEEVIGETLVNDPPKAPLLTSVNVDYDSVELNWSIDSDSSGSSVVSLSKSDMAPEVTGYFLYAKSSLGEWEERQVDASQTSYTFGKLLCGTQYQFYVIAYNNVGKGDPSQAIAVRTKGSAPIAPKNWNSFIAVNSTVAVIRLDAWLVNGCEIKYFVIKYRPRSETDWLVASSQIFTHQRFVEIVDLKSGTWYLLNMAAVTDTGTTEETYMFATLTAAGETLPPLDTISRTLTSATASSNNGGLSSVQSLTIVIPATCSVIVLTVIVIVACFVLGTKRHQQFESTLLTAIGANGNSNGGANGGAATRQNSLSNLTNGTICRGLMGTPHHATPLNSGCGEEPRYGTNISAYEHYGFTGLPNGGQNTVDTFHLSIMSNGDSRKDLCNGNLTNNIELSSACAAAANYSTLKKRSPPTLNGNSQPPATTTTTTTTCLDSKLLALSEGGGKCSAGATSGEDGTGGDTVHYFQTPYALSRITRFSSGPTEECPLDCTGQMAQVNTTAASACIGGCGQQMQNGGSATLRQNRAGQSDHVYDMPFPPKWV